MRNSKTLYLVLGALFALGALIIAVHDGLDPNEYLPAGALLFAAAALFVLSTRAQPDSR